MTEQLRVCAHGGGVQSTAMLVLSAQGKIDFPVHLFCNVGADSENPETITYIEEVSRPFAIKHGIDLVELQKVRRDGTPVTIWEELHRDIKSIGIPIYLGSTGAPGNRTCTRDFKVKVMSKWLKAHGATEENKALIGIGISTNEMQRATNKTSSKHEIRTYPLLELGLSRNECHRIINEAGLPTPPKSACFFCPFQRPLYWSELARDKPEQFEKAVELEDLLNNRGGEIGRTQVFLTSKKRPLREAIGAAQDDLFSSVDDDDGSLGDGECDEGVCFV